MVPEIRMRPGARFVIGEYLVSIGLSSRRLCIDPARTTRSHTTHLSKAPFAAETRMTTPPTFSFVIPCFNEEDNVGPTVGSVREAMGRRNGYEIILINDASADHTLERMQALAAADPRIHVLDNPSNLGFGGSYKRGARVATATYVMMLPGDDGFPGPSIAEIISHAGEADIIIPIVINLGARHWFRAFASKGFTTLLNWAFWLNVGYYNGAVLQRNELLRTIEITTNSFAYQAEALVKLIARGATYKHCYVSIQERAGGRSSALSLKNQIAVWRTILHLLAVVGLFCRLPLVPTRSAR
jgi:glycosyltransferase involved in cell wall biosynthesis